MIGTFILSVVGLAVPTVKSHALLYRTIYALSGVLVKLNAEVTWVVVSAALEITPSVTPLIILVVREAKGYRQTPEQLAMLIWWRGARVRTLRPAPLAWLLGLCIRKKSLFADGVKHALLALVRKSVKYQYHSTSVDCDSNKDLNLFVTLSGECVTTDESCTSIKCNAGTTYISDSAQCPELRCVAPDCDKCVSNQCSWTRLANRAGMLFKLRFFYTTAPEEIELI